MDTFYYQSPIGLIRIEADQDFIRGVNFTEQEIPQDEPITREENLLIRQCVQELDEYFAGSRKEFTVQAKNLNGTAFRHSVWDTLLTIGYGETRSYQEVARLVQNPKAVRAVGTANHHNQLSILYPCHRVIGKNGALTGYGGQLWRKEWLLAHEQKHRI